MSADKINEASTEERTSCNHQVTVAHVKKRKRESNGKTPGRAGSSALLVDPESSDEGAVL